MVYWRVSGGIVMAHLVHPVTRRLALKALARGAGMDLAIATAIGEMKAITVLEETGKSNAIIVILTHTNAVWWPMFGEH